MKTYKQSQHCRNAYSEYKMAGNIVCYYNLANEEGITILLQVAINKIGFFLTKIADCHTDISLSC